MNFRLTICCAIQALYRVRVSMDWILVMVVAVVGGVGRGVLVAG